MPDQARQWNVSMNIDFDIVYTVGNGIGIN